MAKKITAAYALGVDYGTNSVRALLVNLHDGREAASVVAPYRSGREGILLDPRDPNLARQNPQDYLDGFFAAVGGAVKAAAKQPGFAPERVVGLGIDATGSTPLPVDKHGLPLAFQPQFRKNLAAQAWLWKDHTSHEEAAAITNLARGSYPYLSKCGGIYSSEWFWAKILRCRRVAPQVFRAAASWVELADFIPAYLTGNLAPAGLKRGICGAGHKGLYHESWGGWPAAEFLRRLHPDLARVRDSLAARAVAVDQLAGGLTPAIAKKVGLPAGLPVAVGAIDAHLGAVGAGIGPGTLVKIIGTSTCDMMVVPAAKRLLDIPGVSGQVPGSIIPGMTGIEAGQSAVGDIFDWFVRHLCPPEFKTADPHAALTRAAARLRPGASGLLALDWNNGNRNVLVDPRLTGLLVGQTLHTTAPEIYRALIEATAFGALTIVRRLEEYGVKIHEVVACGGIAEKNPLLMQIYADVLERPMKVSGQAQTCALGAAMVGAVAGGAYPDLPAAQEKMVSPPAKTFRPRPAAVAVYRPLYRLYQLAHDAFGVPTSRGKIPRLMKDLIALRDRVRQG